MGPWFDSHQCRRYSSPRQAVTTPGSAQLLQVTVVMSTVKNKTVPGSGNCEPSSANVTLLNMAEGGVGQGPFVSDRVDMAPSGMLQDLDTLEVIQLMLPGFSLSGQAVASSQATPGTLGVIHPEQHRLHGSYRGRDSATQYNSSHRGGCLCCLHGSVTGTILPVTLCPKEGRYPQ